MTGYPMSYPNIRSTFCCTISIIYVLLALFLLLTFILSHYKYIFFIIFLIFYKKPLVIVAGMETKLSIFLCFYALLVFVVTIMPFEDEKQCIYINNFHISTIVFLHLYLINFCLFVDGETKESKKDIRINGYLHNLGKHKIWKGIGGNIINFHEGRKMDDGGNVVKFPSGGRSGYGGKVVNFPERGKDGGRRNIIIFPGVEEGGGGGNVGDGA